MSTRSNRGRVATRNGRPAYLIPMVRHRPPVTNREWQEQRQRARNADIFSAIERLLAKVKP